jgi:hypothetical protein
LHVPSREMSRPIKDHVLRSTLEDQAGHPSVQASHLSL